MQTKPTKDQRFTEPLYTILEAASYLRVPASTFGTWVRGYERVGGRRRTKSPPIVTLIPSNRREAQIPFVGLAEAMVAAAFRRSGVSMQHIRRALPIISKEIGLPHALASRALYSDGGEILYDYAVHQHIGELQGLTVVVSGQRVFAPVIKGYLRKISYARDGWANRLRLPFSDRIIVDPQRAFGQPMFEKGAVRLEDVLDRFKAGDSLRELAHDFGVPLQDVEEVIRGSLSAAA